MGQPIDDEKEEKQKAYSLPSSVQELESVESQDDNKNMDDENDDLTDS